MRDLLIWGLSATAIFFLLYPAMWVAPVKTILRMRTTAENFSETAHAVNFFNGSNARDPGPLFYPVVLAFRSTPILWLGLIAGVILDRCAPSLNTIGACARSRGSTGSLPSSFSA